MPTTADQFVTDIKAAAQGVLNKDITTMRGFSERQLEGLAAQAALVEAGILSGQITAATRDFFRDGIKTMTVNFVSTLIGLAQVAIEKLCNAILGAISKAIQTATGVAFPL